MKLYIVIKSEYVLLTLIRFALHTISLINQLLNLLMIQLIKLLLYMRSKQELLLFIIEFYYYKLLKEFTFQLSILHISAFTFTLIYSLRVCQKHFNIILLLQTWFKIYSLWCIWLYIILISLITLQFKNNSSKMFCSTCVARLHLVYFY